MASKPSVPTSTSSSLTQRSPHKTVHLHSKPYAPVTPSPLQNPRRQLSLARSHAQRPLGSTILVKAEFVYADPGPHTTVAIVGDWNDWHPLSLTPEDCSLWSVVCILPTGHRTFYFLVDGHFAISSRHPVESCGNLNWRDVHGPPSRVEQVSRSPFYEWAQSTLEGLGVVSTPDDKGGVPAVQAAAEICLPSTAGKPRAQTGLKRLGALGWPSVVVGAFSVYLVLAALYTLAFGG